MRTQNPLRNKMEAHLRPPEREKGVKLHLKTWLWKQLTVLIVKVRTQLRTSTVSCKNVRGSSWNLRFNERSGLNARESKLKPNDARERNGWRGFYKKKRATFVALIL